MNALPISPVGPVTATVRGTGQRRTPTVTRRGPARLPLAPAVRRRVHRPVRRRDRRGADSADPRRVRRHRRRAVAAAIPAYLVPFALLQLVSGTIGERLGRRRVVRRGLHRLRGVLRAVDDRADVRAVPRLARAAGRGQRLPHPARCMAGLADSAPPERLGRTIGTFAAVQTAAIALSPLCGGLLGEIDWRLAFLVPAAVAAALVVLRPARRAPRARRPARAVALRAHAPRRHRSRPQRSWATPGSRGSGFLVAIRCRRRVRAGLDRARGAARRVRRRGDARRALRGRARGSLRPRARRGHAARRCRRRWSP